MDVVAIQMICLRAMESLRTLRDEEAGQGLVEYALILALVSVLLVTALTGLKDQLVTVFGEVVTAL